jgi:uncharacterized membrane protein YeaQ/YmgE (transglycosylase-associated protein family)
LRTNIAVGIISAIFADWLLPLVAFVTMGRLVTVIINAIIGMVILLVVVDPSKKVHDCHLGAANRGD